MGRGRHRPGNGQPLDDDHQAGGPVRGEIRIDRAGDHAGPFRRRRIEGRPDFEEEQRHSIEWLQENGNEHGYPPEHVIYSVMDFEQFLPFIKTLAELFIERAAAEDMFGPSASLEEFQKEILSGETYRKSQRWKKTLQSIDVECQSLVYQFRRNVRHSKKFSTRPKTMEVLKKIRKALAARWE